MITNIAVFLSTFRKSYSRGNFPAIKRLDVLMVVFSFFVAGLGAFVWDKIVKSIGDPALASRDARAVFNRKKIPIEDLSEKTKEVLSSADIVMFGDFACPYCRIAELNLGKALQANGRKFRFMPYPMESACNTEIRHSIRPWACDKAKIFLCLQEKMGSLQAAELVYSFFEKSSQEVLRSLDRPGLAACVVSEKTEAQLKESIAVFADLKLFRGVPYFVLYGRYGFGGSRSRQVWEVLLQGDGGPR